MQEQRLAASHDRKPARDDQRHPGEIIRLALPGRKCGQIVEPGKPDGLRHLWDAFADQHQLAGIRQRQGPQQDAIDYGKHRRGCADTEGQQE